MQSAHRNLIILVCMSILLVSLTSGLSFKQNDVVDLKIVCINAGFCTASSQCNMSVFNPAELVLLNGVEGTQSSNLAFHNFTLNTTDTSRFGDYRAGGFCVDGSVTNVIDFQFEITADGLPSQQFPVQFAVILLGFLLVATGLMIERLRLFKHAGSILIMVMGVLTLYPGYQFINWTTLFGKVIHLL